MAALLSLWLPILLSAVFVFFLSSFLHMVMPYHRSNFKKLDKEDEVMAALRPFAIPPGEYAIPNPGSHKEMCTDAYKERVEAGPVAFMTVMENGIPKMGKSLVQWFVYSVIVSIFAGYVAIHAAGPDAHYLAVFRYVGTVAFVGYSLALLQNSIWYKRAWCTTFKFVFDGLLYALVTAGTFGWLWP